MTDERRPLVVGLDLGDLGELEQFEAHSKGYLSTASVLLSSGWRIPVFFCDIVRLAQDLESAKETGRAFIAEPGMIVLDEVTRTNMENAIEHLAEEGFFDRFLPSEQT
jgi:hypothetical protein